MQLFGAFLCQAGGEIMAPRSSDLAEASYGQNGLSPLGSVIHVRVF
jgi:hypothetical protein